MMKITTKREEGRCRISILIFSFNFRSLKYKNGITKFKSTHFELVWYPNSNPFKVIAPYKKFMKQQMSENNDF